MSTIMDISISPNCKHVSHNETGIPRENDYMFWEIEKNIYSKREIALKKRPDDTDLWNKVGRGISNALKIVSYRTRMNEQPYIEVQTKQMESPTQNDKCNLLAPVKQDDSCDGRIPLIQRDAVYVQDFSAQHPQEKSLLSEHRSTEGIQDSHEGLSILLTNDPEGEAHSESFSLNDESNSHKTAQPAFQKDYIATRHTTRKVHNSLFNQSNFDKVKTVSEHTSLSDQPNLDKCETVLGQPEKQPSSSLELYEKLRTLHASTVMKPDADFFQLGKEASLQFIERAAIDVVMNPVLLPSRHEREFWEIWRLSTFSTLEDLPVSTIRLAATGFYHDELLDDIVCFSCGLRKRHWEKNESPAVVHIELSPNCKHANFQDDRNVPVSSESYPHLHASGDSTISKDGSGSVHDGSANTTGEMSTPAASTSSSSVNRTAGAYRSSDASGGTVSTTANTCGTSNTTNGIVTTDNTRGTSNTTNGIVTTDNTRGTSNTTNGIVTTDNTRGTSNTTNGIVTTDNTRGTSNTTNGIVTTDNTRGTSDTTNGIVSTTFNAGGSYSTTNGYISTKASQNTNSNASEVTPTTTTLVPPSTSGTRQRRYPTQVEQVLYTSTFHPYSLTPLQNGNLEEIEEDGGDGGGGSGTPGVVSAECGVDLRRAASPMNSTAAARWQSFANWPSTGRPDPRLLVMAGFYSLGEGDSVRCFYCGVTLRDWRPGYDPWVTHVRFRFSCDYVKAVKGGDFVRRTQAMLATTRPAAVSTVNGRQALPPSQTTSVSTNTASSTGPTDRPAVPSSAPSSARTSGSTASGISQPNTNSFPSTGAGNTALVYTSLEPPNPGATVFAAKARNLATDSDLGHDSCGSLSLASSGSAPVSSASETRTVSAPEANGATPGGGGNAGTGQRNGNSVSASVVQQDGRSSNTTSAVTANGEAAAAAQGSASSRVNDRQVDEQTLRQLQATNQRLRQRHSCRVCRQRPVDIIFLPCGHLCTCESCASTIQNCCLCHQHIRGTARVYLQ